MDTNNYLSYFFTNYYGNLIPTINQIKMLSNMIRTYIPYPKMMYHLYSNESYIDFVLIENGIEQIICLEPNSTSVRDALQTKRNIRSPNKDLVTIYNINPISNEFRYSDADIIFISYQTDLTNIMSKINNECKINTLLIIESYTKPLLQLKCINTINITNNISMYIFKL